MAIFHDRTSELFPTRQWRWFNYLWCHSTKPFRVCNEYAPKQYSKWESIEEAVLPADHRELLKFERIAEFDSPDRGQNYKNAKLLFSFLKKASIPAYIQDHNGRSPHIHFFTSSLKKEEANALIERMPGIDMLKWNGMGLCRAIGGRYWKKSPIVYYSSYFPDFGSIVPITSRDEVMFPEIDLSGIKEEKNDKPNQHKS